MEGFCTFLENAVGCGMSKFRDCCCEEYFSSWVFEGGTEVAVAGLVGSMMQGSSTLSSSSSSSDSENSCFGSAGEPFIRLG